MSDGFAGVVLQPMSDENDAAKAISNDVGAVRRTLSPS